MSENNSSSSSAPTTTTTTVVIPTKQKNENDNGGDWKKQWGRTVFKKSLVGATIGLGTGILYALIRKNTSLISKWAVGMNYNTTNYIQPSFFKSAISFSGNIGLTCYIYFSIEEFLYYKKIVKSRMESHFITGTGMFTIYLTLRKLISTTTPKNLSTLLYILFNSAGKGLLFGTLTMSSSIFYSYLNYQFNLYRLKLNLPPEEYKKIFGKEKNEFLLSEKIKEEEESTFESKFIDEKKSKKSDSWKEKLYNKLPEWMVIPSYESRSILQDLKDYQDYRTIQLSKYREQKKEKEN
ncbi:hypothetical protein ABK040_016176 [Willaertia magna]